MMDDAKRLRRLALIERVRAVEERQAVAEAHHAETVRQRLEKLSAKTSSLAELYETRADAADGAELRSVSLVSRQLRELGRTAQEQAQQARCDADSKLMQLASAEQRHQRAAEEHSKADRALLAHRQEPERASLGKLARFLNSSP